ncbi:MAG: 3-isopropylmalate dehydratase large subunit [Clostridiaceae bacterium]|jgi:3-isopropylmalate/(R)-2-methylmalate dehydratase large subunit|nr:3-isopropylmalate dehydratase large subunit [Clostridiaceae bacterium]
MSMTITQKIIAAHAGVNAVKPGELLSVRVDLVLANDVTAPVSINELRKAGLSGVFDKDKIALVLDHFTPNKDIKSAANSKYVREFACENCITHFYEGGEAGVEHALLPEKGLAAPGEIIIGADSHTCTYGALGAFSTGMGSTDIAYATVTGKTWLKVPEAVKVTLKGKRLPRFVTGKDVMLTLIKILSVDGALYKSLEFSGDIAALSVDDRFTVANMAIECGAKNAVFPTDKITLAYLNGRRVARGFTVYEPDDDAVYAREITIDLKSLEPIVAFPHLPDNGKTFSEFGNVKIDQVVIGSCTNGRISDMRQAAEILKDRKVAKGVRAIIIPATPEVYKQCLSEGLMQIFADAGCIISAPTCGPCLGGHMGILAAGERAVSTTNRNFVGRMGDPASEVYLASPYVAAASAVTGKISHPSELLK